MENNHNISPKWQGFRKLWIIVAIILFLLLLLLLLAGYSPWGKKCEVEPTVVEKVVEKEKLVDNPEHLTRIASLEKDTAQIEGLKSKVAELTKASGLVAGLQAKVKALEGVDLNFESPKLMSKINLLETENASIADLKQRILELEASNAKSNDERNTALAKQVEELKAENGLIAGLQAKVKALEAVDVNFIQPEDNTELLQKINGLEVENLKIQALQGRLEDSQAVIDGLKAENGLISGLQAKVKALEAVDVNFIKPADNTELLQKINGLEVENLKIQALQGRLEDSQATIESLKAENGLIGGLQAKVKALEAIDINFAKPADNSGLKQKVNNLEIQALKIPILESRIDELKTENSLIPGLKAKVKALESIDINFIKNDSAAAPALSVPNMAKLYFESGSSRFPTDVKQSMADVMVYLRSNPSSTVSLAGFHDATGNLNWNRRLAAKRSNRVRQILLDAGIADSRINVLKPSQTLGTGLPAEARRVEVRVSN